jgi:hypothetical protein
MNGMYICKNLFVELSGHNIKVRSTALHAIHLQFDISSNTLEIRALQSS